MQITSTRNPAVKFVRSLERASVRQEHRVYLIEGVRLVGEALASVRRADLVLYDPDALTRSDAGTHLVNRFPGWADQVYEVSPAVLAAAGQTETPAGVVAVLPWQEPPPLAVHASTRLGLVLDRVTDPGNAGTILRTADAFGADYVIAIPGTVDLFSPKVVRAGMGAHFHLDLYRDIGWSGVCELLPGVTRIGLDAGADRSVRTFPWPEQSLLVVGSEAHGLSPEARSVVQTMLRISIRTGVESLNAAVAASIVLYAAGTTERPL